MKIIMSFRQRSPPQAANRFKEEQQKKTVITAFISSNTGELVKRDLSGFLELKTIF